MEKDLGLSTKSKALVIFGEEFRKGSSESFKLKFINKSTGNQHTLIHECKEVETMTDAQGVKWKRA